MSTIITRTGKGSELEWSEVDANFTNLNADKVEITAVNAAVLVETTARLAADALLAPQATTYTKTEVDTALSGKASAVDNTGDETATTIKSKLNITTLSGSNTGDQTLPTTLPASDVYAWAKEATKPSYTASEVGVNLSALAPSGGIAGQVLSKIDATDFNTEWTTPSAGGAEAVINGATTPVGIGGAAVATSQLAIKEVGLANSGALAGSALDIAQTWNTTGNPTALKLNVTNTASGATSKLIDLQINAKPVFDISKLAQASLYNAYTDVSNFERVALSFNKPDTASFTGYINNGTTLVSGATLTVTAITAGVIRTGMVLVGTGITVGTKITALIATTGGTGGVGTYTVSPAHAMSTAGVSITATSSLTAPYAILAAESGGTGAANIGIALSPKGTGSITAQVPDGTLAGGNARGANSVDLQTVRSLITQIASGAGAIALGSNNISSSNQSIAIGNLCSSSGSQSIVMGQNCSASGSQSIAMGINIANTNNYSIGIGVASTVSGGGVSLGQNHSCTGSMAVTLGQSGVANKNNQLAFGFSSAGNQLSFLGLLGTTVDATPLELLCGGAANARATIPNSTTWAADIDIVARSSGGTDNAYFKRRLLIQKGTTAGSTALVGSVELVSTITSTGASTWTVNLSGDTTNGALKIEVTGIAATNIRWVAKVSLVEVGYA